jgi:HTH-type transcriptional regulator/antitoxin HigA
MNIRPIKTKADYRVALKEVEALMAAERGTPQGERLDVLVTLVEAYENKHYPLDLPDPVDAIRFRMEQKGMTPKDLVPMIGQINRVYEILSRRRPLTLAMIQRLHSDLGIPAESLIKQRQHRRAA